MANKAVFLDRDHTLIEDPGYISDPSSVRLLPGVELAMKSLAQVGYKLIVVTNQSGVARGLLTEDALEKIHTEMRRQLSEKGAHLDAIYYCPYHPEGTVEGYAEDSELRKPHPGMLLRGAQEFGIDLSQSWMVGDSPRDIEAGYRAGCRTIRLRTRPSAGIGGVEDEDVQADFTVRNLVDAARVILRSESDAPPQEPARPAAEVGAASLAATPAQPEQPPHEAAATDEAQVDLMGDSEIRREILRHVRQLVRAGHVEEFSFTKLVAGIVQVLTLLTLLITLIQMLRDQIALAQLWATVSVALQMMALSFFVMHRTK